MRKGNPWKLNEKYLLIPVMVLYCIINWRRLHSNARISYYHDLNIFKISLYKQLYKIPRS